MHNCDYCGSEIKRNIFCKPSHQVLFSRKGAKHDKGSEVIPIKTAKEVEKILDFKPMPKICPKHGVLTIGHGFHQ